MEQPRVVVVTGASAGVGRATAVEFARRGLAVALLARGEDGLAGAKAEVEAAGGRALAVVTDVSDPQQVEAAAERVELEFGPIDIWVNAAMVTVFGPIWTAQPDEFRRVTEVTYLGTVHGTRTALQRMLPRNRGSIVQVGSALAYRGIPLQAAYCGAKFAVRGFTDALRAELIHEGKDIHVGMVQLAAFNTPQFQWARAHMERAPQPLPPIFQPELAARAVVWTALHRRRELVAGWPALQMILGARLVPWLLDRVVAKQAWSGQLGDEPITPQRPCNLYRPVAGDFGSHGRFDGRARDTSLQLLAAMYRVPVTSTLVLLLAAGLLLGWVL